MSGKHENPHEHHHHHHHDHSHSHGEMSVKEKLLKLLDHWQHHNEDHARSFEEWQGKAEKEGLKEVAEALSRAAQLTREINTVLENALKSIK